jgi:AcrR family transcriptional regulator
MARKPDGKRKKEIIEITRDLIYTKGFSNFTIREIASRAGISEAAIYRHFSSKEELLLKLLDSLFSPWKEALEKIAISNTSATRKLVKIGKTHIEFLLTKKLNPVLFFSEAVNPKNKQLILVLQTNLRFLKVTIIKIIAEGVANKEFKQMVEPQKAAHCIAGIIQSCVINWTVMRTQKDLKAETGNNIKFFCTLLQHSENKQ